MLSFFNLHIFHKGDTDSTSKPQFSGCVKLYSFPASCVLCLSKYNLSSGLTLNSTEHCAKRRRQIMQQINFCMSFLRRNTLSVKTLQWMTTSGCNSSRQMCIHVWLGCITSHHSCFCFSTTIKSLWWGVKEGGGTLSQLS